MPDCSLPRTERLRSLGAVRRMFESGESGFIFPFRYVWFAEADEIPSAEVLFSVPKKFHKRANKRNLLRRRTKEAYRLQKLLSQAENMEDIITIESAISETEWNIEDLSGTLRHYDALVDFATINVHVSEVYKYSDTEELPENFGDRLSSAMSRGWHSFVNGMEDFAVALAYSWMWLILWAVIIAAAVVILRKIRRRSGMKKPLFKKKNDVKPDDKSGDT